MPINLSAKYYQENKERPQKEKVAKDIKIFLNKKKKTSNNVVVNVTKTPQKMNNKTLLSMEKKYYRMRKYAIL